MSGSELLVGTLGWDHDAWSGAFFPEDLPPEWRLTYYANEYPVVLLPYRLWKSADSNTVAGWADDVPEGFRFFLEAPAGSCESAGARDRLFACVAALEGHCGGVLADGHGAGLAGDGAGDGVRVLLRAGSPGRGVSLYAADPARYRDGCIRALLWESDKLPDLPRRRVVLEELMADIGPGRDAALFLTGAPPDLEGVDETRTLAELLGFS